MSASMIDSNHLRAYLPQSIAATSLMIAAPLAVVWLCSEVLYFELPAAAVLFVSLASGVLCSVVATQIWERRSGAGEISFSELMIWSWYRVQKAERRLERGLRAAETADTHEKQLQILYDLSGALESKDPYTRGHSKRVERYSFLIAGEMGLPLEDVHTLRLSASLHDVGKIHIPNKILHKPGRLSDGERALVQEHPDLGAEMVKGIGDEQVVESVRHHHERWDGDGYPDGLAGRDIPLFARIIAVADSYDAIRSTRSYRPGAGRDETVSIINAESGHQYDPYVVEAFMATLPARTRVVAAFMSLSGPGALWRFLWQTVQRFGSAGLAPVLGALGAAFVIASSTVLTTLAPAEATPVEAVIPPDDEEAIVGTERDSEAARARAERRHDARRDAARRASARRDRRAGRSGGGGGGADRSGSSTSGSGTQNGGAGSGTQNGGGAGSGTQNGGSTPGAGSSSGASGGDKSAVDDPNSEGNDCEPGFGKRSKGSRLHCG